MLLVLLGLAQHSYAQVDFREESIYFLLTTRFFDGDPTNNRPTEWSSYPAAEITDPQDVTWRGDFKGLIQKLDYIKDLGFTAIWITPIVQNWSPLDYHGYHAYDFTKVDPRLESPGATFQDLINEVHARDMKIVLDVVTNHAGRFGIKGKAEIKYNTDPTQPWGQDAAGDPLQPNPDWAYDGLTPNPDDGKIWSRANLPTMPAPYNQNLEAFNFPSKEAYVDTSDPDWYHHSGNGFAQGFDDTENLYNRALAGDTPDLNTSNPKVRDYLVAAYATYINMGVDAFRWDTIKHMSKEDVLYFLKKFKEINPDLFVFGEVAQKRHELHPVEEINPHWYTWEGAVNASNPSGMAVIDFYAQSSFHNTFEYGGSFGGVKAAARYDHLYADPSTNLLWLDNHDFGPNNDWNRRYGGTAENLAACMNFMFTWRGIPIVYYGTEMQFMKGVFADIHEASDINRSIDLTGRAYYGEAMDQAPNHRIYQHIKKLNAIRKAVPALQKGSWRWDGDGGNGNGVGYVREHGDSKVAVGLAKDGAVTFNFNGLANGIYRDAVTGNEINVTNGSMSFTVQPASAGIYVLNGPGMIGGNGVGYFEGGNNPGSPIVSINPASGHYGNQTISVNITANRGTIYYTTDGSQPSAGSKVYTGPFNVSTSTTVKAIAIDGGDFSTVVENRYTFGDLPSFKVHFYRPDGWNNTPHVHYWNVSPAGVLPASNWPGIAMTNEGNGWYAYTFVNVTNTNLLFSDNGNPRKTVDLTRSSEGWYYDGQWYDTRPNLGGGDSQAPSLAFSPNGGSFSGTVSVTITTTDDTDANPTIYYTVGGGTPTTSSTSATGSVNLSINATTTVRAFSVDASGNQSDVVTKTFTVGQTTGGLVVHFYRPDGWNNTPRIYYWGYSPANALPAPSWPGAAMTNEGNGWYSYTLQNVTSTNLLFSDNGNPRKTADLTRASEGWYYDGQWYDSQPTIGGGGSEGITVHFYRPNGWNNTPHVHYWNYAPANALSPSSWPGPAMDVLIKADLRGIDSHGVARLVGYVRLWKAGRINPTPDIKVVHETPGTATIDGDAGLGLVVTPRAMEIAMDKAANVGTGWVAIRNSNHFGIAGYHAMMGLEKDMIGWAFTNASPLVSPTFGMERMLGTNPIAVSIPAGEEPPFVADLATTTAANGKLEILQRKEKDAPLGWIQTADGAPTTDPHGLKKGGALLPLGGDREHGSHKGYALGALVDILSAVLSGANYGPWAPPFVSFLPLADDPVGLGLGHFVGAMRVDAFRPADEFKHHMDQWIQRFRETAAVDSSQNVLIPGDPEREFEAIRKKEGIPLVDKVVEDLSEVANDLGVEAPKPL